MTVSTVTSRKIHSGDGSTTEFAFDFYISAEADLLVKETTVNGVESTKVLTTDYTINAGPWPTGGTVTFVAAPPNGYTVTFERDVNPTQATDYTENDDFPAETHEAALDKLTTLVQQLENLTSRCLQFKSADQTDPEIPNIPSRTNRLLGFNASGVLTTYENSGNGLLAVFCNQSDGSPRVGAGKVISVLTESTWVTLDGDNYDFLNDVPVGADWLELKVYIVASSGGTYRIDARATGGSATTDLPNTTVYRRKLAASDIDLEMGIKVPLNAQSFDIWFTRDSDTGSVTIVPTGYGYN